MIQNSVAMCDGDELPVVFLLYRSEAGRERLRVGRIDTYSVRSTG